MFRSVDPAWPALRSAANRTEGVKFVLADRTTAACQPAMHTTHNTASASAARGRTLGVAVFSRLWWWWLGSFVPLCHCQLNRNHAALVCQCVWLCVCVCAIQADVGFVTPGGIIIVVNVVINLSFARV